MQSLQAGHRLYDAMLDGHAAMPAAQRRQAHSPQRLAQVQYDDATRAELLSLIVEWLLANGLTASAQLLHEEATGQMREAYYQRKVMRGLCGALEDGNWDAAQRQLRKLQQVNVSAQPVRPPTLATEVAGVTSNTRASTTRRSPPFPSPACLSSSLPPSFSCCHSLAGEEDTHATRAATLASLPFLMLEQQMLELVGEDGNQRAFAFFMRNIKPLEGIAVSAEHVNKLAYVLTCSRVTDAADVYADYRNWTPELGRARLLGFVRDADAHAVTTAVLLPRYCYTTQACETHGVAQVSSTRTRPGLEAMIEDALSYQLLRGEFPDVVRRVTRVRLASLLRPIRAQLPALRVVHRVHVGELLQQLCVRHATVMQRESAADRCGASSSSSPTPPLWSPHAAAAAARRAAGDEDDGAVAVREPGGRLPSWMVGNTQSTAFAGDAKASRSSVAGDTQSACVAADTARVRLVACEQLPPPKAMAAYVHTGGSSSRRRHGVCQHDDGDGDDVDIGCGRGACGNDVAMVVATSNGDLLYVALCCAEQDETRCQHHDGASSRCGTAMRVFTLYQHNHAIHGLQRQGDRLLCYGGRQAVILDVSPTSLDDVVRRSTSAQRDLVTCTLEHNGDVHAGAASACGTSVVTGLAHGTVTVWDATTTTATRCSEVVYRRSPVCALVVNHTGTVCYAASRDGVTSVIDVATGLLLCTMTPPVPVELCSIALSPSSTLLLASYRGMPLHVWNAVTGTLLPLRLEQIDAATQQCKPVAFTQGDEYVVAGTESGYVVCYDLRAHVRAHTHEHCARDEAVDGAHDHKYTAVHRRVHHENMLQQGQQQHNCGDAHRRRVHTTEQAQTTATRPQQQHNSTSIHPCKVQQYFVGEVVDVASGQSCNIWISKTEVVTCQT